MEDSLEAPSLSHGGDKDDTRDLLRDILTELRRIGGQLRHQDDRLNQVERKLGLRIDSFESNVSKEIDLRKGGNRKQKLRTALWTPILAEIQSASGPSLSLAEIVHIYRYDLVGIDQFSRNNLSNIPFRDLSFQEREHWSKLVGFIWNVPEDGRLSFKFQKRWLMRPSKTPTQSDSVVAAAFLARLASDDALVPQDPALWLSERRSNISISDFFEQDKGMHYDLGSTTEKYAKQFEAIQNSRGTIKRPSICTSGPWRRIICIRGLEYRATSVLPVSQEYRAVLDQAIEDYQDCRRRRRETRWVEWDSGCTRFHITYYKIQHVRPNLPGINKHDSYYHGWKGGRLHSDKYQRLLCECAYTTLAIPGYERGSKSEREYWTLLELRPANFAALSALSTSTASTLSAPVDVLQATMVVADKALMIIHAFWKDILDFFDQLINEKNIFLDPERHDNLLSDDETFSRSKTYFWALTTLKELDLSISDNLLQIQRLLDSKGPAWVENSRKDELEDARSCLRIRYRAIEEVAIGLREKRQDAMDLRDGLFSASAVIESRASTRLGENVKLLTFVSIFFLPLSFCMSVWSVSDTLFSLTSLIIVSCSVALSTYLTVFNLDTLVHFYQDTYRQVVERTISSMKSDRNETWRARAKAFEKFSTPRRIENKPSDWRLVQYALKRVFWPARLFERNLQGSFGKDAGFEMDVRGPVREESNKAKGSGSRFGFWRRRTASIKEQSA